MRKSWQENNQGKTRSQITKLDIWNHYLEDSLVLVGFDNLKELVCSSNYLTELTLNNCPRLEKIDCSSNNISNLDFLTTLVHPEKLKHLNISNNNFSSDLTWLTSLVNLKELILSYNNFQGSLAPLQNLTKLEKLDIGNTDLNSGEDDKSQTSMRCVEYLPESLKKIYYSTKKSPDCKLLEIKGQLDSKYWVDIHWSFQPKDKKKWIETFGFTKEQTREWINVGLHPQDYDLVYFARNSLGYEASRVSSEGSLENLKNSYRVFEEEYSIKEDKIELDGSFRISRETKEIIQNQISGELRNSQV